MPATTVNRRLRPLRMVALALVVLVIAAIAGFRMYRFVLDGSISAGRQDFLVYQQGAWSLRSGGGLYDHSTDKHSWFTYPPFAALLFLPLTLFSFRAGYALWMFAELAVLVWVVHVAFRPAG